MYSTVTVVCGCHLSSYFEIINIMIKFELGIIDFHNNNFSYETKTIIPS